MSFLDKKVEQLNVIVFDLDYTLWPFWVDTHVTPPFQEKSGKIVDVNGKRVKPYEEVSQVLANLRSLGYELAVASRTSEITGAYQLLELLDWKRHFSYFEIYPGCKITHLRKISSDSGVPLSRILFFDDEMRNIRDIESIGGVSILVDDGVSRGVISAGIENFVDRQQNK